MHRTDYPNATPYGFNAISASHDWAYFAHSFTTWLWRAPENAEYFDFYLTGADDYSDDYMVGRGMRFNGEEWSIGNTAAQIIADRAGTVLRISNVNDYLVLTSTPERKD